MRFRTEACTIVCHRANRGTTMVSQRRKAATMALADIFADHPDRETFDFAELHRAVKAASECALACSACADSDLRRDATAMSDCIRRCIDCADICAVTAKMLSRPSPNGRAWEKVVAACAAFCMECAEECVQHDHLCCQKCAEACRECEKACQQLLAAAQS